MSKTPSSRASVAPFSLPLPATPRPERHNRRPSRGHPALSWPRQALVRIRGACDDGAGGLGRAAGGGGDPAAGGGGGAAARAIDAARPRRGRAAGGGAAARGAVSSGPPFSGLVVRADAPPARCRSCSSSRRAPVGPARRCARPTVCRTPSLH